MITLLVSSLAFAALFHGTQSEVAAPELRPGDRICLVGNALAERQQHHGWVETRLQRRLPEHGLTFRNLGFSGDEVDERRRTAGFGTPDEWLDRCDATVVFAFFGFAESFAGEAGLAEFERALTEYVDHVRGRDYSGEGPPRVVLFTSIPFEFLDDPMLPSGTEHNQRIRDYNAAIERVGAARGVPVIDIYAPMQGAYDDARLPDLTIDGIHLNDDGQQALALAIEAHLFGTADGRFDAETLRREVLAKNHWWFNRYRVTDGYNVYGGRSALRYTEAITSGGQDYSKGLSNLEVMQREMAIHDAMTANADRRIHAVARGRDPETVELAEVPPRIPVPTNRPVEHPFLGGDEAVARMTPAEGMEVNLFAGEEQFPELANPVQMAWDTRGRLWVATWPTYPHWTPGEPMNDKLVILEDTDGDGRADTSTIFADDLHNPTGFEFWGGGVFVAGCPDLLFLEDTDGDDRADRRERVLHGLSSADTHHASNSFVLGPDGALYFQEGTFHMSQVESIHGVVRNGGGCVWRYEPRTRRVERYIPYGFANPHGHVFDRWGQDFMTDGTGNVNYYALPFSGHLDGTQRHSGYFPFFQQRSRPCGGTEILSSPMFPEANQGNYLIANVIGFQGIFQYELVEDGSGFGATEVEPLVHSSDPNFRPVDIETGPDGAVYFLDWHNPLIGHMQHHLRDPGRDAEHGRVYRVSWRDGPRVEPEPIAGRSEYDLIQLLRSPTDRVRYRARIELSARPRAQVMGAIERWLMTPGDEHFQLELLWAGVRHGEVNRRLLEALLESEDHRPRAAATRVVRHQRHWIADALDLLAERVVDEHPRVRLEALVGLSHFGGGETGARAAELALSVLHHDTDRFLDYALGETLRALEPDWRAAALADAEFSDDVGLAFLLDRFSVDELKRIPRGGLIQRELLGRHGLEPGEYAGAIRALAAEAGRPPVEVWEEAVREADEHGGMHADHLIGSLFAAVDRLGDVPEQRIRPFLEGKRSVTRLRATAEWLDREEPELDELADYLSPAPDERAALEAAPWVRSELVRERLYEHAAAVLAQADGGTAAPMSARHVRVELHGSARTLTLAEVEVFSGGANVAPLGTATQSTVNWGGTPDRAIDGNRSGSWSDGGQTHTMEDRPDPWWELDLGREVPIEEIVIWNRTDGDWGRRLDDVVVKLRDAQGVWVAETGVVGEVEAHHRFSLWSSHADLVRRAAVGAIAGIDLDSDRSARILAGALADPVLRGTAVSALRTLPMDAWADATRAELARLLLSRFDAAPEDDFLLPGGRELLVLADELAPHLTAEPDLAARLLEERRKLGPQAFVIRPIRDAMVYDVTAFSVVAGKPVELVFDNVDIMPHNLLVTAPGALALVGQAGEAMAREADGFDRGFVPALDEVLVASRLLQPGQRQTLSFTAPAEPGSYPYVCTFPGHWVRMNGIMTVVASWDELGGPVEASVNATDEGAAPARPFVRSWTADEFHGALEALDTADAERGRALVEEASCLRCHAVDGEGGITGPDLRDAVARLETPEALLAHLIDPSLEIREGYESELFFTTDGGVVAGRVMGEEPGLLLIQDDPYRDDVLELPLADIEERRPADLSLMPAGLLSTLQRDEILDLLAFLESLREE